MVKPKKAKKNTGKQRVEKKIRKKKEKTSKDIIEETPAIGVKDQKEMKKKLSHPSINFKFDPHPILKYIVVEHKPKWNKNVIGLNESETFEYLWSNNVNNHIVLHTNNNRVKNGGVATFTNNEIYEYFGLVIVSSILGTKTIDDLFGNTTSGFGYVIKHGSLTENRYREILTLVLINMILGHY